MTLPPSKLVGHTIREAPTEHVPHPGTEHPLACPACGNDASLQATYMVKCRLDVAVNLIPATSAPEVEVLSTGQFTQPGNPQHPVKIGCESCGWSYEGPDPLAKLVQA